MNTVNITKQIHEPSLLASGTVLISAISVEAAVVLLSVVSTIVIVVTVEVVEVVVAVVVVVLLVLLRSGVVELGSNSSLFLVSFVAVVLPFVIFSIVMVGGHILEAP